MNTEQRASTLPPHLVAMAEKMESRYRATVSDVTPEGYGPSLADAGGETTEMRKALNAIDEGNTLLRSPMEPDKREAIERSVMKARYTVKALRKAGE